ncbi:HAD family hydrolase [Shewanella electrodiphila]|uniref:HAD family hydrolase n=1 Tax=Shewanella electrodiphila TaxID=934143 RepID=A0ABT0KQ94_9GAMM|nr:HAD family hydrolase [Shewanella electrodiphila]MCL1045530.1 HAD family hydrolase [Shewanella electrodiphila]
MKTMTHIKGVIFDLDGTLVESELDFGKIKQQLNCPFDTDVLDFIEDMPSLDAQQQAHQIIIEHEALDAMNAKALPHMHALLASLQQLSLPTAIVTRNSKTATATKLSQNNIAMELVLTRECYPAKPAPDALLAIAKMWDIEPASLIYVGDYLYDIQAAKNAGMVSVFINHNKQPDYQSQADFIVNDLLQLQHAILASNR